MQKYQPEQLKKEKKCFFVTLIIEIQAVFQYPFLDPSVAGEHAALPVLHCALPPACHLLPGTLHTYCSLHWRSLFHKITLKTIEFIQTLNPRTITAKQNNTHSSTILWRPPCNNTIQTHYMFTRKIHLPQGMTQPKWHVKLMSNERSRACLSAPAAAALATMALGNQLPHTRYRFAVRGCKVAKLFFQFCAFCLGTIDGIRGYKGL